MKDQINTIRELLNGMALAMPATANKALAALSELEAMVGAGEQVADHTEDDLDMVKARKIAREYAWPNSDIDAGNLYWALHVALRHIDAAPVAQQYEAGDVASASAQGFRDGVASVAQQPQEIEVQCPVCNHKFYEWPNDKQPQAEAAPPDVVRDAERLDWLLMQVSGKEFRRIGVEYSDNCQRADIDAAIAQQKGQP